MRDVSLATYTAIPRVGIYEDDLFTKLVNHHPQIDIECAIALLAGQNFIKKAGCAARPIYVRLQNKSIVHKFLEESMP